jgi:hypothetical protein
MKTSSKKTVKTAAKSAAAVKSSKAPTAAQMKARSIAAYKAHITRQNQIIEGSKSKTVKAEARDAIKAITANMKSA